MLKRQKMSQQAASLKMVISHASETKANNSIKGVEDVIPEQPNKVQFIRF